MDRITSFSALTEILSTFLNSFQDAAANVAGINGLALGGADVTCVNGTDLKVSPYDALTLGGKPASNFGTQTVTPSGLTTLVANTWYYLYAYINAGAVAYEVSTTFPDPAKVFKPGDPSRRYVCPFKTYSAATTIRQFTYSRGLYQWRLSAMTSAEASLFTLRAGSNATTSGYTALALDDVVPATARLVDLHATFASGTALGTLTIQPSGDTGTSGGLFARSTAAPNSTQVFAPLLVPIGLTSGTHPGVDYNYNPSSGSAPLLQLDAYGFRE